jgi:secondary thiamine-phosphate synthase enzyme
MHWFNDTLSVNTRGKGMYKVTEQVNARIKEWGIQAGMCFLFLPHTSASLVINESYDPSAKRDMETFMDKLAPENQSWHEHTMEGGDDSPSHMRAMITQTNLTIPIDGGELDLGTWQGIYLFEHRRRGERRKLHVKCLG